jgi:hypothetical protein
MEVDLVHLPALAARVADVDDVARTVEPDWSPEVGIAVRHPDGEAERRTIVVRLEHAVPRIAAVARPQPARIVEAETAHARELARTAAAPAHAEGEDAVRSEHTDLIRQPVRDPDASAPVLCQSADPAERLRPLALGLTDAQLDPRDQLRHRFRAITRIPRAAGRHETRHGQP